MADKKAAQAKGTRKASASSDKADGEAAVLATLAAMPEADRTLGTRIHEIVRATAPALVPRMWYGMPAYAKAGKDGKVVCFFQAASKFKTRYATFGFQEAANLDDGGLWPTAFGLTAMTTTEEATIRELVTKAVSS